MGAMKLWRLGLCVIAASCQPQDVAPLLGNQANEAFQQWVQGLPAEHTYPISMERTITADFQLPQEELEGGKYAFAFDLNMKDVDHVALSGSFLFTLISPIDVEYKMDYHLILDGENLLGSAVLDPGTLDQKHAGVLPLTSANRLLGSILDAQKTYRDEMLARGYMPPGNAPREIGAYFHPSTGLATTAPTLYCDSWLVQEGKAEATLHFDLRPGSAGAANLKATKELMDIEAFLQGQISVEDFWYYFDQIAEKASVKVIWDLSTGTLLLLESDISLVDRRIEEAPAVFELAFRLHSELRPITEMDRVAFALPEDAPEPFQLAPIVDRVIDLVGAQMELDYGNQDEDF